jgi:cyclase
MLMTRVIPCLLLRNQGLVKTIKFKDPKYLGDPINIVKIFNDKEVDEIVFLDITATLEKKKVNLDLVKNITSECFMPLGYGGGIKTLEDVKTILRMGVEKVIINTNGVENPSFIKEAANFAGSQSVVASIDCKNVRGRYEVFTHSGTRSTGLDPVTLAVAMEQHGAGELLLTSIDLDGSMQGYDIEMIRKVCNSVSIPVVACGGAGNVKHLTEAVKLGGASAVAAGSMFVFHGSFRAVLISYPSQKELKNAFA